MNVFFGVINIGVLYDTEVIFELFESFTGQTCCSVVYLYIRI